MDPGVRVRVLYDYEQQNPLELSIKRGDIIVEVQKDSHVEGFWTGFLNGQFGIFPSGHVEIEGIKKQEINMELPENEINSSTAHLRRNTGATDTSAESFYNNEQTSDTNVLEENNSTIEYDSSTIEDQIFYVKAIFPFRGSGDPSELIFEKDDVLKIKNALDQDWWVAEAENGTEGWIPSNYVEVIDTPESFSQLEQETQKYYQMQSDKLASLLDPNKIKEPQVINRARSNSNSDKSSLPDEKRASKTIKHAISFRARKDKKEKSLHKRNPSTDSGNNSLGRSSDPEKTGSLRTTIRSLMKSFIEQRPTQMELLNKKILESEVHNENPLPLNLLILKKCFDWVEQVGLTTEGIYRMSGQIFEVRKLCQSFASGNLSKIERFTIEDVSLEGQDPITVCSAIKLYLRELEPPLIPYVMYDDVMGVLGSEDPQASLAKFMQGLPSLHKSAFALIIQHLKKVSDNVATNQMTPSNLGIVLGPCLVRSKKSQTDVHHVVHESEKQRDLIIFCIQNAEKIMELVPPIDFQQLHVHSMITDLQDALIATVTGAIQLQFKTLEERLAGEMKKKDDRIAHLEAELAKIKNQQPTENSNKKE